MSDIISFVGFSRTTQNAKKNLYDVREADFNISIEDLPQIVAERTHIRPNSSVSAWET